MTYNELIDYILSLSDSQRNMDVTLYCEESDEYYPVVNKLFVYKDVDDVITTNQPYLQF